MSEMSPGTALRQLQHAQAGLRKARQALRIARESPDRVPQTVKIGWEGLANAHKILGSIPLAAATEPVMTKQLAVERYATALLVRLRRVVRNEPVADSDDDDNDIEEL